MASRSLVKKDKANALRLRRLWSAPPDTGTLHKRRAYSSRLLQAEVETLGGVGALGPLAVASAVDGFLSLRVPHVCSAFVARVCAAAAAAPQKAAVAVPSSLLGRLAVQFASSRFRDQSTEMEGLLRARLLPPPEATGADVPTEALTTGYEALVACCVLRKDAEGLPEVMAEMRARGVPLTNKMRAELLGLGGYERGMRILSGLAVHGAPLNASVVARAIRLVAGDPARVPRAEALYASLPQLHVAPDVRVFHALLHVYSTCGDVDGCLRVSREMHEAGFAITSVAYACSLSACVAKAETPGDRHEMLAERIHGHCVASGLCGPEIFTAMMLVYAQTRNADAAHALLRSFAEVVGPVHKANPTILAAYAVAQGA
eukprot:Rhum_TRINITY_DN21895_c0_g1::Rhum_TRINITY_DN21895_c0_g1_i1::g.174891::m.174891